MNHQPKTNMIPIGLIVMFSGLVIFVIGMDRATKTPDPAPVEVGEKYLSSDPFLQQNPVTILETNGSWVKFRQALDNPTSFRSATLAQFHAWYPNKYQAEDRPPAAQEDKP